MSAASAVFAPPRGRSRPATASCIQNAPEGRGHDGLSSPGVLAMVSISPRAAQLCGALPNRPCSGWLAVYRYALSNVDQQREPHLLALARGYQCSCLGCRPAAIPHRAGDRVPSTVGGHTR